jgi:hypothetical protein
MHSRKFIGHEEVRAGLRIHGHPTPGRISFSVSAVCDSVHPEAWHGEVTFGDEILLCTQTTGDHAAASRAAEKALAAKVVEIFRDL